MSSLDLDVDMQMISLESQWRQKCKASIVARAEYQALSADRKANAEALDGARERLDRAEAGKAIIMARIERMEERMLSAD